MSAEDTSKQTDQTKKNAEESPEQPKPLGLLVNVLVKILENWTSLLSNSDNLNRWERVFCAGAGTFTWSYFHFVIGVGKSMPGGVEGFYDFIILLISDIETQVLIIIPTAFFGYLIGYASKRPVGAIRLYLDGILLPTIIVIILYSSQRFLFVG